MHVAVSVVGGRLGSGSGGEGGRNGGEGMCSGRPCVSTVDSLVSGMRGLVAQAVVRARRIWETAHRTSGYSIQRLLDYEVRKRLRVARPVIRNARRTE